jgi:nicotinamide-nucleotide amidase
MVAGSLRNSSAQVALSVSGIAGPDGGTPDKPVGTVWFAWGIAGEIIQTRRHQLAGDRIQVRNQSVRIALQGVIDLLNQHTLTA